MRHLLGSFARLVINSTVSILGHRAVLALKIECILGFLTNRIMVTTYIVGTLCPPIMWRITVSGSEGTATSSPVTTKLITFVLLLLCKYTRLVILDRLLCLVFHYFEVVYDTLVILSYMCNV